MGLGGRESRFQNWTSGHNIGKLPVRRYRVDLSQIAGNVNPKLRKEVWARIICL